MTLSERRLETQRAILKLASTLPDHYTATSTALFGIAERCARAQTMGELHGLIEEVRATAPSFVASCRDLDTRQKSISPVSHAVTEVQQ